jgi:preprotein translocase subunit SecA
MLGALAKSLFGSSNDRYVKSLGKTVAQIAAFEPTISALTDEELTDQTRKFRERLSRGRKPGRSCCPKPSPPCARLASACSECATSMCR